MIPNERRLELINIKKEMIKDLQNQIHALEIIPVEDCDICQVCGEIYNRTLNGVCCSYNCFRCRYM